MEFMTSEEKRNLGREMYGREKTNDSNADAIKEVVRSRLSRGASKESIIDYLEHLMRDTWKSEDMRSYIDTLIQELK
jgi:hypothetical protein